MTDSLRNDQRILRTFILYEALERKPVFDAYKHFCSVMGENVMEYREFEYWFYRFYHGNYDLDCDIGWNPKSLLFSELPAVAIRIVVGKLDLVGRLILRKVSSDFRFLVDNQLALKNVRFLFRNNHIFAQINEIEIVYSKYGVHSLDDNFEPGVKFITSKKYLKAALNDIAFALKNPKVQLESLKFDAKNGMFIKDVEKFCGYMKPLLKSLDHQISVKSFSIHTDKPKKSSQKMTDSLRKDPKFLRSCILYEVLHGKSVEEAYKNLCKVMGNDFMEFTEFDFYFYRFYHGNYDLDYDRKSDPKSRLLSELSIDVIGKIMENLELKEQLTLRKVSRGFQYLIDQLKLAYASIYIFCEKDHIYTEFNNSVVVYTNTGRANEVKKNYQHELPRVVEGSDFVKMAYGDIEIALESPKIKMESIELNYVNFMGQENAEKIYDGIRNLVKTIKHKIPVKRFSIKTSRKQDVVEILSSLKPGILENVSIEDTAWATWEENVSDFNEIDELMKMDQWKKAKVMNIRAWISTSIQNFFHFESFDARINFIPTGDVIKLRNALFKSANFEKCCVKTREELNDIEIERLLGQYVTKMRNRPDLRFYPIPNSKEFLQFTIDTNFIIVKREH